MFGVTLPVPFFLFPVVMVVGGVSGISKSKTSTIEVTAEMEKEVMTLDDDETFGNFYKSVSPSTPLDSSVVVTEEDLSQIQTSTPKSVHNYQTCLSLLLAEVCDFKSIQHDGILKRKNKRAKHEQITLFYVIMPLGSLQL